MAEISDHNSRVVNEVNEEEEYYVENIRVFNGACKSNKSDDVREYDGVLLFKIRERETGRPGLTPESFQYLGVPFGLEVLIYMCDEDPLDFFYLIDDIIYGLGLFGSSWGRVALEIGTFLRVCFRFESWTYDSVVLVVDVANEKLGHDFDYEVLGADELAKIEKTARLCWGGVGVDMEMEAVRAGARIKCGVKRPREEEEECSICLREMAEKEGKKKGEILRSPVYDVRS